MSNCELKTKFAASAKLKAQVLKVAMVSARDLQKS
jgi:hypothetical protein